MKLMVVAKCKSRCRAPSDCGLVCLPGREMQNIKLISKPRVFFPKTNIHEYSLRSVRPNGETICFSAGLPYDLLANTKWMGTYFQLWSYCSYCTMY